VVEGVGGAGGGCLGRQRHRVCGRRLSACRSRRRLPWEKRHWGRGRGSRAWGEQVVVVVGGNSIWDVVVGKTGGTPRGLRAWGEQASAAVGVSGLGGVGVREMAPQDGSDASWG
jgi:hypothetical protein